VGVGEALSIASTLARGGLDAVRDQRAGRRVWTRDERAYVEARGLHEVNVPPAYVEALERHLSAEDGVRWAAVNGVLGDVIVDYDSERVHVGRLRQIVAEVERDHGMAGRPRDRPIHPSDFEQVFDRLLELGGDLLASAVSMVGQVTPSLSLPAEALALPAVVELLPGDLKQRMERKFGTVRVELVLSLLNAAIGAAAHTPLSTVVDGALRAVEIPEALASRRTWERRAPELAADYAMAKAVPMASPGPRPTPLPPDAAGRYARRARTVTDVIAAPLLALGGARKAARAVLIGTPKAATMGADAFAAELGRLLASRGTVIRDPDALRCLDRVDTVVIDRSALHTGRMNVVDIVTATKGAVGERARQRIRRMFDPHRPTATVRDGHWRLAPLADLDVAPSPELSTGGRADQTLGLVRDHSLVGVVALGAELDPQIHAVVAAAHQVGRVVVAPATAGLVERAGVDGTVAGGSRLAASVRALQRDGHVVALVAGRNESALAAADLGIGVIPAGGRPPWAAHVLCGPGLTDAWLILQAAGSARTNSDRGSMLALLGALTGAVIALAGPEHAAGRRGSVPVNAAALASIIGSVWSVRRLSGKPVPVPESAHEWHAMAVEETLRELRTSVGGLTDEQAQGRPKPDGEQEQAESFAPAAVAELNNPLTAPLAAGAVLSGATGSMVDAFLVAAVMAGNAALGAGQRVAASRAVRKLASAGAVRARLRRDGAEQPGRAADLVPGDVVVLYAGDVVPADCRLIEADHLEVDESSLTGESMLVGKDPRPTDAATVADRSSMLYAGTTVAAGTGAAAVVATGRGTESNRGAAAWQEQPAGGVEAKLARMSAASVPLAAGAAAIVFAAGLLRGRARESIPSAVALAVAAVPEGLPFTATIAQLAAARRLSKRDVLVRTPRTLEALGRVDVVCFDKTGTLTEGKVDVSLVSDGTVDEPVDTLTNGRRLVLAAALRASPVDNGDEVVPHPTDRAVSRAADQIGITRDDDGAGWRKVRELPFEPGRGFHAVLGRSRRKSVISVKGAPETVLPRCVAIRDDAGTHDLDPAERRNLEERTAQLARSGYRVLAVAERAASNRRELGSDRVERLLFLGFLGLADPIRPTAMTAVNELRRAGVEVVMLTGDHPNTATAVASDLDLLDGRSPVTGAELQTADESTLDSLVRGTNVFARVSPADKVSIVRALKRAGRVVAVTGDGANDAPAIRLADVGIAVGEQSTDATRQAADIIVVNDRIETIVDAVIESRAMWRSVRDSVELLLGGNLGEILFTTGSSLASARPPLNARQLLLTNLMTDLVPALAVAVRPPRHATPESLFREGPEAAAGGALNRGVIRRAIATAAATTGGWVAARATGTAGRASTVALTSLVGAQLAQTAATAKGDPVVLAAVVGSALALAAIVQSPPTSLFFGCRPLGPVGWGITLAASAAGAALGASLPD
jgi:cation-transporting ATPase I